RIHREVAGKEADPPADLEVVVDGVEVQYPRRARGRADQVEQQAERGRFSGAVRTEEAEHLPPVDLEVKAEQAPSRSVVLRETAGGDRRPVTHGRKARPLSGSDRCAPRAPRAPH